MTYFFISLLQISLPFALLLATAWANSQNSLKFRPLVWLALAGFALGIFISQLLPTGQTANFIRTSAILVVLLLFLACQLTHIFKLNQVWHFLLSLSAGLLWAKDPNTSVIININVVNTDLLLNIAAVVFALLLTLFMAALQFILFAQVREQGTLKSLRTTYLILCFLLVSVPLIGELLLAMMKLQVIDLTKGLVSFVAKSGILTRYANYFIVALQAVILLLFFAKVYRSRKAIAEAESDPINKRKKLALRRDSGRVCGWLLAVIVIVLAGQLYWDQVASRPPQLSKAEPVTLSADGNIHIPTEQFKDNKLHRFAWHTEEGKLVRFFIINRIADKFSLGVVFDACLLCGDQGYVMQGNQVVCIGCGVYMFTPSIGKAGGCNPVPIEGWQQTDSEVIIPRASLEAGIPLFSNNYSKGE